MAQDAPAPPAQASAQVAERWWPGHDIAKFGTAKGLFEHVQLLMPFDNPAKIDDAAKTAIVAYTLVRNGTLGSGASMPTGGDQTGIK